MNTWVLVATVFAASAVEAVEALTIVLAAGLTRDWRSALTGVGTALVVLALLVAALGPLLRLLPLSVLRLVVGGLLLTFGLQWLRKAMLRASGWKATHDEDAIYQRELAEARAATAERRFAVADWYAFVLSFKGVLLEGLEVVFIVLSFGANNHHRYGWAAAGALAAALVVAGVGSALRAPLARVPENTLKFGVGVMLTSFGMFWGAEGAGAHWPGGDAALLAVVPAVLAVALCYVSVLRAALRRRQRVAIPTVSIEQVPG